jgi:hypothetical protein
MGKTGPLRHLALGAQNSVLDGRVDLLLHCAFSCPTRRHLPLLKPPDATIESYSLMVAERAFASTQAVKSVGWWFAEGENDCRNDGDIGQE